MATSRLVAALSVLTVGLVTNACSQGIENIGEQQGTQNKTGLDAYAANWDGYVEANTFRDGSDRVRITINSDATGTILIGKEDPWPPPTDPNAKYPPDYQFALDSGIAIPWQTLWDGFRYSLKDVRIAASRLHATAASSEVFATWCSQQTPHPSGTDGYSCSACDVKATADITDVQSGPDTCYTYDPCSTPPAIPNDPTQVPSGYTKVPISCSQQALCGFNSSALCVCDATSCQLATPTQDSQIDAALEDNLQTLTGTLILSQLSWLQPTNYTIRLKRQ